MSWVWGVDKRPEATGSHDGAVQAPSRPLSPRLGEGPDGLVARGRLQAALAARPSPGSHGGQFACRSGQLKDERAALAAARAGGAGSLTWPERQARIYREIDGGERAVRRVLVRGWRRVVAEVREGWWKADVELVACACLRTRRRD
jgi:hypothetical protein